MMLCCYVIVGCSTVRESRLFAFTSTLALGLVITEVVDVIDPLHNNGHVIRDGASSSIFVQSISC